MRQAGKKPARTVEFSVEVNAPVEAVWKALSDGDELARWFPLEARVTPGVGGSVWMSWGEPWVGEAKIEVWEPNHHLRNVEPPPQPDSIPIVIDYFLESRGGKTLVRVVQSFGTGADWEDEYYESISRGWPFMLANLRHYLEHHLGKPRQVAWPRVNVDGAPETLWQRLLSSEGFQHTGSLANAKPGERYSITAATGDTFEGVVQFFRPPWGFCGTVENLKDSLVWLNLEKMGDNWQVAVWLSAYGWNQEEVDAFAARWQNHLRKLFPEAKP